MLKKLFLFLLVLFLLGILSASMINEYVVISTKDMFMKDEEIYPFMDCVLILGAGVSNNEPSLMLKDRLDMGISLYQSGLAKKIIMSGDHGRCDYDEVAVMKNYALNKGVLSEDIFMDHAGFSTYDSVYRAKKVFDVKKMFLVSQEYHLYRALYLAKRLGIEAVGVPAEKIKYTGEFKRELREFLARDKDFFKAIFLPPSTYLGKTIPVTGNGDVTNDSFCH